MVPGVCCASAPITGMIGACTLCMRKAGCFMATVYTVPGAGSNRLAVVAHRDLGLFGMESLRRLPVRGLVRLDRGFRRFPHLLEATGLGDRVVLHRHAREFFLAALH